MVLKKKYSETYKFFCCCFFVREIRLHWQAGNMGHISRLQTSCALQCDLSGSTLNILWHVDTLAEFTIHEHTQLPTTCHMFDSVKGLTAAALLLLPPPRRLSPTYGMAWRMFHANPTFPIAHSVRRRCCAASSPRLALTWPGLAWPCWRRERKERNATSAFPNLFTPWELKRKAAGSNFAV